MALDVAQSAAIDLKPLLDAVIGTIASVVLALGVVAVRKLNGWLTAKTGNQNLLNEDLIRSYMHNALDNGVKFAVAKVGSSNWAQVDVKNALVAEAASYALTKVPDAIKYFNLSSEDLEDMIQSKLTKLDPALGLSAPANTATPTVVVPVSVEAKTS